MSRHVIHVTHRKSFYTSNQSCIIMIITLHICQYTSLLFINITLHFYILTLKVVECKWHGFLDVYNTSEHRVHIVFSQPLSCHSWRCLCYFHETHLHNLIFRWIRNIAIGNIHYIPQVIMISRSRCWNPSIRLAGVRMLMIEKGANASPRATAQCL